MGILLVSSLDVDVFGLAAESREGRSPVLGGQTHVVKTELRARDGTARQSMWEE